MFSTYVNFMLKDSTNIFLLYSEPREIILSCFLTFYIFSYKILVETLSNILILFF